MSKNYPEQEYDCKKCIGCCEPAWKGYTRHLSFGITLLVFFILIFTDGNVENFNVKEAWLPILETVLTTMALALFASRGVENTARIMRRNNEEPKIPGYREYPYAKDPEDEEIPEIYKKYKKDA